MICSCQIVTPYVSAQDRFEVGVRVGGGRAVAGGDVLLGHAAGHRAGPEESDVGDDVLRVAGLQPAEEVLLAR